MAARWVYAVVATAAKLRKGHSVGLYLGYESINSGDGPAAERTIRDRSVDIGPETTEISEL
jgi:hypothetical protein